MFKRLSPVALLILFAVAAFSQNNQTPTPTPVDNDVVKISTNLIRIDVSVSDGKGKSIPDLRQDEFEVYENGVKRKITGIMYVSSGVRQPVLKPVPTEKDAIAPPAIQLKNDQIRRTFALVVDDFDVEYTRLLAAGIEFQSEPQEAKGTRTVFFSDPEDNYLHLIQRRVPLP